MNAEITKYKRVCLKNEPTKVLFVECIIFDGVTGDYSFKLSDGNTYPHSEIKKIN